jgi:1-deoxy-D-xylulose-5-phosphate reductoisomerase
MEKKGIAICGSTGSIGTQTLEIVKELGNAEILALVCNTNIDLLARQIIEFKPKIAAVLDESLEQQLKEKVKVKGTDTKIVSGKEKAIDACTTLGVDIVVNSLIGIAGLEPTIGFIKAGKTVALANKESLVTAGSLVMKMAVDNHVKIIPIDSEHSAIFQCIAGNQGNKIEKLIITASGGPFRNEPLHMLRGKTVEQTLAHPTWPNMGKRITIDSATLMNKGFEVIEAKWLFGVGPENIQVVVHPSSTIHSAVQFEDGSVMAQLGIPEMRLPIQYALNYPKRLKNSLPRFDFIEQKRLDFEEPDMKKFRCLALAFDAMKMGGVAPAVLNGADEKAVELFLSRKISFTDIPVMIETALLNHTTVKEPNLNDVMRADKWARNFVESYSSDRSPSKSKSLAIG